MEMETVRSILSGISDMLEVNLEDVIQHFKPDGQMAEMLEGYMPAWGKRTLHEFMVGVIAAGQPDEPDISNMSMEPFNLFEVLNSIYRSSEV